MEYYEEKINRYRVLRRENYDPNTQWGRERRASLILHDIDPDDNWSLIWSMTTLEAAEKQAEAMRENYKEPEYTIMVKDAGEATVIKRPIW